MRTPAVAVAALGLSALAGGASGSLYTYIIDATIDSNAISSGALAGLSGDFTFTVVVDPSVPAAAPGSTQSVYDPAASVVSMTFAQGSVVTSAAVTSGILAIQEDLSSFSKVDRVTFDFNAGGPDFTGVLLDLYASQSTFPDTGLDGTGLDQPVGFLDIPAFISSNLLDLETSGGTLHATITSFEIVPAPGALLVLAPAAAVRRRRR